MKWKRKEKPAAGTNRVRIAFAWLPELCNDGYWRWLERVKITEVWQRFQYDVGYTAWGWKPVLCEPLEA